MNLAKVIGHLVTTVKDPCLQGKKILCLQPVDESGGNAGSPCFAVDTVGAGAGETVIYMAGVEASFAFSDEAKPCDGTVVGVVDRVLGKRA